VPERKKVTKGRFIVLDGPDGAGKSTQIKLLAQRLEEEGVKVLRLREPGGTALGEAVRNLLLSKSDMKITPVAEAFLFQAARAQLVSEVIRPALESGQWVLCDRFSLSTLVYQGYAGGMDLKTVKTLSEIATQRTKVDRYLVLWVSPETGVARRADRAADRMESKGDKFLRDVSAAFKQAANEDPRIYKIVDGVGSIDEVQARIWKQVEPLLK
jgi:dTMP kinase